MASVRYYKVKTKRRKFKTGRLLFILVVFAFLMTLLFTTRFLGTLNALQDQAAWVASLPKPAADAREHLLIYSVSHKDRGGLITGIALAAYHPKERDIRIIQIPTETLLEVDGQSVMPVADIYDAGSRELLLSSVSKLLDLPIHAYFEIDEDFLPSAIDLVGVSVGDSGIIIENGGDVLTYIHSEGLTAGQRFERRRQILALLAARILEGGLFGELRSFHNVSQLISTNLSWRRVLSLMRSFESVRYIESVHLVSLPGQEEVRPTGKVWLPDSNRIAELVEWLGNDTEGMPRSQITVEVLNGCGVAGAANEVAQILQNEGYQVVRIGNADRYDHEVSQVISRTENIDAARNIAVLIPNAQLLKEESSEPGVLVTVIVGKNYR